MALDWFVLLARRSDRRSFSDGLAEGLAGRVGLPRNSLAAVRASGDNRLIIDCDGH